MSGASKLQLRTLREMLLPSVQPIITSVRLRRCEVRYQFLVILIPDLVNRHASGHSFATVG